MRKILGFLLLLGFSLAFSQKAIYLVYSPGYFLDHSENAQPITYQDDFKSAQALKGGLILPIKGNLAFELTAGYQLAQIRYDSFHTFHNYTLSEESFPIELDLLISSTKMTGYGVGFSFVGTNHKLELDRPLDGTYRDVFNSRSIGLNGFIRYSWNIRSATYLLTDLCGRYIQGIKFNGAGRDFSNYNYNYFELMLSFGVGYKMQSRS